MRFHWFAQQYYTTLPEDYGTSIHSSWVTAPTAVADPTQVGENYRMYLRLMQDADDWAGMRSSSTSTTRPRWP